MSDLQKQVQEYIEGLVDSGAENGVQAAVYQRGDLIVDAVAGTADAQTGRPVTSDTLFYAASAGKAVTATVVHVLVEHGLFGYETHIADIWPEFAAHGKAAATVRHALTHSAGVPGLPMDMTLEQLCDWDWTCRAIADATPWWPPGEKVGYHAQTFGFILGEIVRRATGKPISQVLAEEVAGPLGIADEMYFAVPADQVNRVAKVEDDPEGMAIFTSLPADWPLFKMGPRELMPRAEYANRTDVLTSDIPSGGTLTARAVARMYSALYRDVDGVRLVSSERFPEISTLATTGMDEMTGAVSTYALGYCVGRPGTSAPQENPTIFGMVGIGVGAACADSAAEVSIAVLRNRFNPTEMNFFERVTDLVYAAL